MDFSTEEIVLWSQMSLIVKGESKLLSQKLNTVSESNDYWIISENFSDRIDKTISSAIEDIFSQINLSTWHKYTKNLKKTLYLQIDIDQFHTTFKINKESLKILSEYDVDIEFQVYDRVN